MARIGYTGSGSPYERMLAHSPRTRQAVEALRDALKAGTLPARLRMLSTLTVDRINECRY